VVSDKIFMFSFISSSKPRASFEALYMQSSLPPTVCVDPQWRLSTILGKEVLGTPFHFISTGPTEGRLSFLWPFWTHWQSLKDNLLVSVPFSRNLSSSNTYPGIATQFTSGHDTQLLCYDSCNHLQSNKYICCRPGCFANEMEPHCPWPARMLPPRSRRQCHQKIVPDEWNNFAHGHLESYLRDPVNRSMDEFFGLSLYHPASRHQQFPRTKRKHQQTKPSRLNHLISFPT